MVVSHSLLTNLLATNRNLRPILERGSRVCLILKLRARTILAEEGNRCDVKVLLLTVTPSIIYVRLKTSVRYSLKDRC